jgi:putative colanic acid biosynthesis UDP-glucose lipid carrier transferase
MSSVGPILFKQKRHGWDGREIRIYKFRTMVVHEEEEGVVTQARRDDPRVTRFGAFLRRSSLDELPQFFNVLQGRMSIVGPRPHALAHNELYKDQVENYMLRHRVKPGITGWAQINGYRGETESVEKMRKRVEYDLYYIENWSLWFDLKIIFLTIFKGFWSNSAY